MANMAMDWLDDLFGDRVVSQNCRQGMLWSSSSPCMNPCGNFLWGYLKSKTYCPIPKSKLALKAKITREFRGIPPWMVTEFDPQRAQLCIDVEGGTFKPWM